MRAFPSVMRSFHLVATLAFLCLPLLLLYLLVVVDGGIIKPDQYTMYNNGQSTAWSSDPSLNVWHAASEGSATADTNFPNIHAMEMHVPTYYHHAFVTGQDEHGNAPSVPSEFSPSPIAVHTYSPFEIDQQEIKELE